MTFAHEWGVFGTVALAHALAVVSPGPDFAMVTRQSLAHGRAAGVWTAAGIGSGIVFHLGYGLFGLGWLVERHPPILTALAMAGALFLFWMGVQALRARPLPEASDESRTARSGDRARYFGIGVLTNVLNPKAVVFFVALFTAVITSRPPAGVLIALAVWLPLATFAWFAGVATVLGSVAARKRLRRAGHWIDRAMGLVLLALGVAMLAQLDF